MNQFRVVVLLLATLALPVQASSFTRLCAATLRALGVQSSAPSFTAEETQTLVEWARRYTAVSASQSSLAFTAEQMTLALSELPVALRNRLIAADHRAPLPFHVAKDAWKLLEKHGFDPNRVYPLGYFQSFLNFYRWQPPERALAEFGLEIEKAQRLSQSRKEEIYAEIALRREVSDAMAAVSERRRAEYRLRFEGNEIVTPEGKRYRYRKTWSGKLRIEVPYHDLIRTQHYVDNALVAQYRQTDWLGYGGFEGELAPDGRVILIDQHHRTNAYALNHPGPTGWKSARVPIVLDRADDGHYYTATHWAVLANFHVVPKEGNYMRWFHDKTWSFLAPEERRALLDAIARDPVEAIRPYYYESTGLTPLR